MTALFSKPKVDNSAQLQEQRRQTERVREQEVEEGIETGSRNRILNARLQARGIPTLASQSAPATTLAG